MNLANQLTVLRILLVPVFIGSLLYYSPEKDFLRTVALAIFSLACLTDAMDGYLARALKQKTELGSYLDPIADKLLLLGGFLSLSLMEQLPVFMRIPAWVTITIFSRDVLILIGAGLIFVTTGSLKASPIFVGKVTTFFQMMTLLASLIPSPEPLRLLLFVVTVFLTVLSAVCYIRIGSRLLQSSG